MIGKTVRAATISILCFVMACGLQITDEEQASRESVPQEVRNAFMQKDFARLEAMATEYRQTKTHTPSGLTMLGRFYYAFDGLYGSGDSLDNWLQASATALEWADQFPDSPTPHIVHAALSYQYAWKIRGGGWASTVRDSAWEAVHQNLTAARAYLEDNKAVAAQDPHWYALLLSILKAERNADDKTVEQYYMEGIGKYPLYLPIHMETLQHFLPKWGGSADAMDRFILFAAEQVEESQRDALYARLYWAASGSQFYVEKGFFQNTKVDWDRMKRGMTGVVKEYPDTWNIFHFAYFACFAGDKETAKKYIDMVRDYEATSKVAQYTPYGFCKEWVYNNGPDVPSAQAALDAELAAEQQRARDAEKYWAKNRLHKEQMRQEYERRRMELVNKSPKNLAPGTPEWKAASGQLEEELMKLEAQKLELETRDLGADWGLDYETTEPVPEQADK